MYEVYFGNVFFFSQFCFNVFTLIFTVRFELIMFSLQIASYFVNETFFFLWKNRLSFVNPYLFVFGVFKVCDFCIAFGNIQRIIFRVSFKSSERLIGWGIVCSRCVPLIRINSFYLRGSVSSPVPFQTSRCRSNFDQNLSSLNTNVL